VRSWLRRTLTGQCLTRDYTARPSQAGQKGTRNAPTASRRTMGRQAASTTPTPQSLAGFKAPHNPSQLQFGTNQSGPTPMLPKSTPQQEICRNFNGNRCRFTRCRYRHVCTECAGPHAALHCRNRQPRGPRTQPEPCGPQPTPPPAKPSLATRSNRRGRPGQAAATSLNLYLARYSRRRRR
jgi:hypothetical protein